MTVVKAEKKVGLIIFETDFLFPYSKLWWAVKSDKPMATVTAMDSKTPSFQSNMAIRRAEDTITTRTD